MQMSELTSYYYNTHTRHNTTNKKLIMGAAMFDSASLDVLLPSIVGNHSEYQRQERECGKHCRK
jgi:hypothetical protein